MYRYHLPVPVTFFKISHKITKRKVHFIYEIENCSQLVYSSFKLIIRYFMVFHICLNSMGSIRIQNSKKLQPCPDPGINHSGFTTLLHTVHTEQSRREDVWCDFYLHLLTCLSQNMGCEETQKNTPSRPGPRLAFPVGESLGAQPFLILHCAKSNPNFRDKT